MDRRLTFVAVTTNGLANAQLPGHCAGEAGINPDVIRWWLTRLIAVCAGHGLSIGVYTERILDDPLPWTRMRSVYRLQGLVTCYGPKSVETACRRALDLDVVSVSNIAAMLAKATESHQPHLPAAGGSGHNPAGGRFARNPGEYARSPMASTSVHLTLIPVGTGRRPHLRSADSSVRLSGRPAKRRTMNPNAEP